MQRVLLALLVSPAVALTVAPSTTLLRTPPAAAARRSLPLLAADDAEKPDPLALVKEAGLAGIVSYFCVEVSFFAVALPTGYVLWHANTGEWLQPLLLLQEGSGEDKVRLVGLILSYIVLLKTLFPLRLGATLALTPKMRNVLNAIGAGDSS